MHTPNPSGQDGKAKETKEDHPLPQSKFKTSLGWSKIHQYGISILQMRKLSQRGRYQALPMTLAYCRGAQRDGGWVKE